MQEKFFLQLWDYLFWNYLSYKVLLYRNNKKKKENLYIIVLEFLDQIENKEYNKCFKKYMKQNDFLKINSKKRLIEYMKNLRTCLDKNVEGLVFKFSETMKKLEEISKKENITLRNPVLWGKPTWLLIHMICLDEKCKKKQILIELILNSLPCNLCRKHVFDYLKKEPLEANHNYFFRLHNDVNMRLKKKSYSCPEKAKKRIISECKNILRSH